jgi:broad specificity phosphatase PhoE
VAVDQTEPVTSALRYISHPNVLIDPDVPVPDWSLNAEGQRRAQAMTTMAWTASIGRIISSNETKARMTADILAAALGLEVEVRPETGEIDRSATGYLSHERHSELARRLFAEPDVSAEGWETATDAQARVVSAAASRRDVRRCRHRTRWCGNTAVLPPRRAGNRCGA